MCVMSMVHDHFDKIIPTIPWEPSQTRPLFPEPKPATIIVQRPVLSPAEIAELRQLIKDFRDAVTAAAAVDRLTKQPDCVDPEKAKLEERVAELERRLDSIQKTRGVLRERA